MPIIAPDAPLPPAATPVRRRRRRDDARATIVEVAGRAGVSTATASRALNTPERVSQALRARVLAAAVALAYVPDPAARTLASHRSGLVGIVTGDLRDGGTAACLASLQPPLATAGYASVLAVTDGRAPGVRSAVAGLAARGVEAIVLVDCADDGTTVPSAAGGSLPVVRVGAGPNAAAADLAADAATAGATIARYLLDLGHTTFGWVAADGEPGGWLARLRDGLSAAVIAAGRRPPAAFAVAPGATPATVLAGSAAGEPMPSALVCADDLLAIAVVRALAGRAISVPRHVSVVGCGDQPWARHADPPLTSLRIPAGKLGEVAADHVLARLRGESPGAVVPVAKIVVRGSTGPAAGTG
jgi:DNA-binding LacI/PurR family transcriptional regulator